MMLWRKTIKLPETKILYGKTLEKIIALKDSLYKNNSAQSLAEMQTKYEVQKRETLIAKQQLDLWQRKTSYLRRRNFNSIVLGFLLYRFKNTSSNKK